MKTRQIHSTSKDATDQQNICGNCFSWVEGKDNYCWSCGAEFTLEEVYSMEELRKWLNLQGEEK